MRQFLALGAEGLNEIILANFTMRDPPYALRSGWADAVLCHPIIGTIIFTHLASIIRNTTVFIIECPGRTLFFAISAL